MSLPSLKSIVNLYIKIGQCWKIYKSQYRQQANHLIVEGSQAHKAWFFLHKSVLTISFVSCLLHQGRTGNQRKVTLAEYLGGNFPSQALSCFEVWIILKCLKRNVLSSFCHKLRVISVRYSEIIYNNNKSWAIFCRKHAISPIYPYFNYVTYTDNSWILLHYADMQQKVFPWQHEMGLLLVILVSQTTHTSFLLEEPFIN